MQYNTNYKSFAFCKLFNVFTNPYNSILSVLVREKLKLLLSWIFYFMSVDLWIYIVDLRYINLLISEEIQIYLLIY
jgi:hypothetical protein